MRAEFLDAAGVGLGGGGFGARQRPGGRTAGLASWFGIGATASCGIIGSCGVVKLMRFLI